MEREGEREGGEREGGGERGGGREREREREGGREREGERGRGGEGGGGREGGEGGRDWVHEEKEKTRVGQILSPSAYRGARLGMGGGGGYRTTPNIGGAGEVTLRGRGGH